MGKKGRGGLMREWRRGALAMGGEKSELDPRKGTADRNQGAALREEGPGWTQGEPGRGRHRAEP